MQNITAIACLFKHGDWYFTNIHKTNATINFVAEYIEQIGQAARETPLDVAQRDIVAAMCNPFRDTHFRYFGAGQGKIDQFHLPAITLQPIDQMQITTA